MSAIHHIPTITKPVVDIPRVSASTIVRRVLSLVLSLEEAVTHGRGHQHLHVEQPEVAS